MSINSNNLLTLDFEKEVSFIVEKIKENVVKKFKRKGVIVAISGGIDSSLVLALAVKTFGAKRVITLSMPEQDSSSETMDLCYRLIDHYKVKNIHEDITPILESLKCYERRDHAIKEIIPAFKRNWKSKIVLPSLIESEQMRFFSIVCQSPDGEIVKKRLTSKAYLEIVAASNFKQRVRKMLEYYHADRLNFATTGTPNKLEYDQGFFVKNGDGQADIKPIAHLYKTQVYEMARYLGVPEEICNRAPTTDTYSMPQSQEEFYFSLPYDKMDYCLYGTNNNISAQEIGKIINLTEDQVLKVYKDIDQKRKTTIYQHAAPIIFK